MKPTSLPRLFAALFATLTLGVTAPACSSYIDEAIAPSMWSSALCKARLACGCAGVANESEEECRVKERHTFEQQRAFAQAMGLTYDADCLSHQLESLKTLGCDRLSPSGIELCAMVQCSVYHSELGLVVPCNSTDEFGNDTCGQGGTCVKKPGGDGSCNPACASVGTDPTGVEPPTVAGDGEICFDRNFLEQQVQCGPSSFCDVLNTDRCKPLPGVGASCDDTGLCASNAFCDNFSFSKPFVCKAKLADGAACNRPEECANANCESGVCAPAPAAVCVVVSSAF